MSIKPCPACDALDHYTCAFTAKDSAVSRACLACGASGPWASSEAAADAAWNALPRRGDGLAWRSEPPDRPGWWLFYGSCIGINSFLVDAGLITFYETYGGGPGLYCGPIPEPPAPDAEKEV